MPPSAIEQIKAKLTKCPAIRYESSKDHIRVLPASEEGFLVELIVSDKSYVVHFNGWHESFSSQEEALNCFALGLSTRCRLKEHRRRGVAYKWIVEYRESDKWIEDSETGTLLFYPFWGKLEIRHLQNSLIDE